VNHVPHSLPFGIFSVGSERPRAGVALGDQVLDLARLPALPHPAPAAAAGANHLSLAKGQSA
jgi:hypothetical protein